MPANRPQNLLVLTAVSLVGICWMTVCFADGPKSKPAPSKPAAGDEAPEGHSDPYAVPEGDDSEVLGLFIQNLAETPPASQTPEGGRKHLENCETAFTEIMKRKVDEQTFAQAASYRFQCLMILGSNLGDKKADGRLATLAAELDKDERKPVAAVAKQVKFQLRLSTVGKMTEEERLQLIADMTDNLKAENLDPSDLRDAMAVVQAFESKNQEATAAIALTQFAKALSVREEPGLEKAVRQMESNARRLSLVGNMIEIKGKTIDGKDFDIADWKGKVVLVDFWATWCGPCRAELPNVKKMYARYHDKGFEVVGISLDDHQTVLDKFLTNQKITWTTLFDAEADEQGWENPIARQFGISAIPAAILVNKDGKVITLRARGEALREHLEKLLGSANE